MIDRLRQFTRRLFSSRRYVRTRFDPDDPVCDKLAGELVSMKDLAAAAAAGGVSPGTDQLLARARIEGLRSFTRMIGGISRGIAASAAAMLALAALDTEVAEATEVETGASTELDRHDRAQPERPPLVNRFCAHPACLVALPLVSGASEELITAPGLRILYHGERILGVPAPDVLAGLLALVTLACAAVAAECFLTWRLGRPTDRALFAGRALRALGRVLRRQPESQPTTKPAATTTRDARMAGVAGVLLVVGVVTLLGWFAGVRQQNVNAAHAIEAGDVAITNVSLPGLPGAPTAAAPIGGLGGASVGQSGGPIAGLGGAAATPLNALGGAAPAAAKPGEGSLGPVGLLSVAVFLLAVVAATLAGATQEHVAWSRKRRALRGELAEARKARVTAQRERARVAVKTPAGSVAYDTAARYVTAIVDSYLQIVVVWQARVSQAYAVGCQSNGTRPVALAFPRVPSLAEELERLLRPVIPNGQQAGGIVYGSTAPAVEPDGADRPPPAPPPPAQDANTVTPPPRTDPPPTASTGGGSNDGGARRPDRGDVLADIARTAEKMRQAAGGNPRRRTGRTGGPHPRRTRTDEVKPGA